MEDLLRPIYQERASHENTLGVLMVEKQKPANPVTDNFDIILLVIVSDHSCPWFVKHYDFDGSNAAMHIVDENQLRTWVDASLFRQMTEWIIEGKIVFDRNGYVFALREELIRFPRKKRELKMAMEFAKLTRSYSKSRELYGTGQYLDANNSVLRSLHYLARLSIIEKGFHPEVTLWKQVKRIDAEVYKLYEEFVSSEETLEKRINLMLIGIDFATTRRAESCAKHLIEVMKDEKAPWSIGKLISHPAISLYSFELSSMVDFLTDKGILAVELEETKGKGVYHRLYKAKK